MITNKETLFITKVTEAFHKIIEDDQAWEKLKFVFEDHLMLTKQTIKDVVLPNAYLTIRDDIFMEVGSLEDVEINGVRLSDRLIQEYNALYKEKISFQDIQKNLYKLHFAVPKFAISNPDRWNKDGRPLSAKGYELSDNNLQPISKDRAEKLVGSKKLSQLMEAANVKSPRFYSIENKDGIHVIAGQASQGALLSLKDDQSTIQAFEVKDHTLFNTITLKNENDTSTHFQQTLINQTYGPTDPTDPTGGCIGFYVFDCDGQDFADHQAQQQAYADENCQTVYECIPCCNNGMGIYYLLMMYEPSSWKCAKHQNALEIISLYPPFIVDNDNT